MKAMILAAGLGKRMQPLTKQLPKPLLTVGGKALIEYHIANLQQAGVKDIVINIAHLGEKIQAALGNGKAYGVKLHYSLETSALETGGGIFQALPLLGTDPFIVINGDIWTDYPLRQLPNAITGLAHLVLVANPSYRTEGDFVLTSTPDQRSLIANPSGAGLSLTFSGISVLHPDLFKDCQAGCFPLAPLLRQAIERKQVTGELYQGQWCDVGTPERLERLNKK